MDYYRVQTSDETLAPIGADNNSLNIACDSYAPDYWNNTYVNGLSPMKQIEGLFTSSLHITNYRSLLDCDKLLLATAHHLEFCWPFLFAYHWSHIAHVGPSGLHRQPKNNRNIDRDCKPFYFHMFMLHALAHMLLFASRSIGAHHQREMRRLLCIFQYILFFRCTCSKITRRKWKKKSKNNKFKIN